MRSYQVPANALRMSRLLAWCGNFLNRGADLALLFGYANATRPNLQLFLPLSSSTIFRTINSLPSLDTR
jgi:hypothetical protein